MIQQIATTREQSDRLLQCGVTADSADMCYDSGALSLMDYDSAVHERDSRRETYEVVPAFSLSALLALLPKVIESHSILPEKYSLLLMPKDNACMACYANKRLQYIVSVAQPIIEACVQIIEWLTANNYKLNGIEKGGEDV